jgi:hypothetical protein
MADVQIAVIDTTENEVNVAVPGVQGPIGLTGSVAIAQDGTATEPGIRFENDTNTGIYRPGADQLAISTNGTGRLFVDASGNVGIGTTPSYSLHVSGTSAVPAVVQSNQSLSFLTYKDSATTDNPGVGSSGNNLVFYTTSQERMRLDSSGRLGLGTSSPGARLQVNAPSSGRSYSSSVLDFSNIHLEGATASSTTSALTFSSGGGGGAAVAFSRGSSTDTSISFWTNSAAAVDAATERLIIDSSGRVGIGTMSPGSLLHLADAGDITVGTTTGTKIGTATTQKIGLWNATPVVQPAAVANITTTATAGALPTPDGAITIADTATPTVTELLEYCVELETKLEDLLGKLRTVGIIAT